MQILLRNRHFLVAVALAAGLSACDSDVNTTSNGAQTSTGSSTSTTSSPPATASSPTVAISSTPAALSPGQSATLAWNSTNATACSASGAWTGTMSTSGSKSTGALKATAKYMLTCTGAGGSTTQSATVTVNSASSSTAPTVAISANPSIVASGGSATLTWTSTGATACTASGAWSGTEAVGGTRSTGTLSADTTYILNCTGPGGSTQQSTTVTISAPVALACSGSSGPLNLKVSTVRSTGVSPFLMFFDATATTDSAVTGNATTFQNVTYKWDFGDFGASGTGVWAYGANAGHNSKNTATGGIAAHLYVTPGTDTAYTATVTATDGTNTTSCQLGVTTYDPAGMHGFAGAKTTCVSASGTPVPGSGDCPAGAAVLNTSSFNTALGSSHFGSGKRVLFKCGDTFTGDNAILNGTTWSVGAYGG
jgi:hypothetical protein